MHLALTDRICCPRCGPEFGLILLAQDIRERRVLEGTLGCPGCRHQYPVRNGFGDLRVDPAAPGPEVDETKTGPGGRTESPDEALRLAAAMGVTEGPGTLLIKGPVARYAGEVANLVGGIEVVAVDESLADDAEEVGVSRFATDPSLPFLPASFKSVLLSGEGIETGLLEAVRVLVPAGRLVALDPGPGLREAAEEAALTPVLEEKGILVAQKQDSEPPPLVTLRGLPDRS